MQNSQEFFQEYKGFQRIFVPEELLLPQLPAFQGFKDTPPTLGFYFKKPSACSEAQATGASFQCGRNLKECVNPVEKTAFSTPEAAHKGA